MAFQFDNLDNETRRLMSDEIKNDINNMQLYYSKRFNEVGNSNYAAILQQSVMSGDEVTLIAALNIDRDFKTHEEQNRGGKITLVRVPKTAHITLAEDQFNRFYMRALALRAIENGHKLQVYRARHSDNPRTESRLMEGRYVDPHQLLADLRKNNFADIALGLPPGPNSGLTVRLIKE
jgi:hypothetical protein